MFSSFKTRISMLVFGIAVPGMQASAAIVNNILLSLVPADAEIVAGIQDPHNSNSRGRLLLVTRNNNLDLNDWLALTGVDSQREVDQLIEVAASSPRGELSEHLLLVAGHFDPWGIFHAAEQNGATTSEYRGTKVLLVTPFARERQEMPDTRWMAILDYRTALFGTPALVRKSLDRASTHQQPDELLLQRLAQLHTDVNSWNVLAMSAPMLTRHVAPGQLDAPWAHILDGAHELTIGIHYGSTARIDFGIRTDGDPQASSIAAALAHPQLLLTGLSGIRQPLVQNISVDHSRVLGSITVPGKQFDMWLAAVWQSRALASSAR